MNQSCHANNIAVSFLMGVVFIYMGVVGGCGLCPLIDFLKVGAYDRERNKSKRR